MTYRYRVTLNGIKGFFRVYQVSGSHTLYSIHKQMRSDMEFPQDQLILFKALGEDGEVIARYGLFDLGDGAVDSVTIGQTLEAGVKSFVYFYDVTEKKSVNVTFDGESTEPCPSPTIVESKGPNPIEFENGYVAFEDLPDDQRHLPSDKDKPKRSALEDLLNIDLSKDFDEDEEEDEEDLDDEDEDDDEDDKDEDCVEIFDGSEDLTL